MKRVVAAGVIGGDGMTLRVDRERVGPEPRDGISVILQLSRLWECGDVELDYAHAGIVTITTGWEDEC